MALSLLVAGVLLAGLFVAVESRASEPIIPLELFRISAFSLCNVYGFVTGFAMFGTLVFMPVYLQVVAGMSPTRSGLAMLPMVAGIFTTSISSGIAMTRTGRYKIFLIVGASTVAVALFMLSRLSVESPYLYAAMSMYLFGAGLGFTMQIIVTIVQNSVDRRHMGAGTSSVAFFRSLGGTFGAAVFGAIVSSRLAIHLAERLDEAGISSGPLMGAGSGSRLDAGAADELTNNVQTIQRLPEPEHTLVLGAFADSLREAFWWAIPVVLVALAVSFFVKEVPLRSREAAPSDETSPVSA